MAPETSSPRPQPRPQPKPQQPSPPCFTGNICSNCGGVHLIRAGTCECCQDCGTTTGCS